MGAAASVKEATPEQVADEVTKLGGGLAQRIRESKVSGEMLLAPGALQKYLGQLVCIPVPPFSPCPAACTCRHPTPETAMICAARSH